MANSSDWIASVGEAPGSTLARPGWISALALDDGRPANFRDTSPFAPAEQTPRREPERALQSDAGEPDAMAEAHAQGFAEGRAAAQAEAEQAVTTQAEQWRSLRLAFRALDAAAMETLAEDLSATVLSLCEPVLRDYAVDEAALKARCKAAAERIGGAADTLTLHLHPETVSRLGPDALEGWQVAPDPTLDDGELRLTGADGAVREGPEDWIRAIRAAIGAGVDSPA